MTKRILITGGAGFIGSHLCDKLAAEGHASAAEGGKSERLHNLATMQLGLLTHALTFPSARVVVYSTCSIHPIENELVVAAALRGSAVRPRDPSNRNMSCASHSGVCDHVVSA